MPKTTPHPSSVPGWIAFSALAGLAATSLGAAGPAPDPAAANRKLLEAAERDSVPLAEMALAEGATLDASDPAEHLGQTPLIHAAQKGSAAVTRWLLAAGADPNRSDTLGLRAVHYAAFACDGPVLEALLGSDRTDVWVFDSRFASPVRMARERGCPPEWIARMEARVRGPAAAGIPQAPRYLVVNFLGAGGGGEIDRFGELEKHPQVDHVFKLLRDRRRFRELEGQIAEWMAADLSQGGSRRLELILVGSSWGAVAANRFAAWYQRRFGRPARMEILVDGANLIGFPIGRMGEAETTLSYRAEGFHWPRGGKARGAQRDVSLGAIGHDEGLFTGAAAATQAILEAIAADASLLDCRSPWASAGSEGAAPGSG